MGEDDYAAVVRNVDAEFKADQERKKRVRAARERAAAKAIEVKPKTGTAEPKTQRGRPKKTGGLTERGAREIERSGGYGGPANPQILGPATQDDIATAFEQKADGRLRFCHDHGTWLYWTGNYWQRDGTMRAFNFARTVSREQSAGSDDDEKKAIRRATFASGVERFARAAPKMACSAKDWDSDIWLLGTPKGTVDLRTGDLRAPDQIDGITKITAVAPAMSADCPDFLSFLKQATGGDDAFQRFLKQIAGYCLTGVVREHVLLFVYGPGGTGKTTFLKVLTDILAAYAVTAPMTTFVAAPYDQHPTDLAMLRGARLVSAAETERGRTWADQRLRLMTGGDPITARFMRQDFFTYIPQFKCLIVGNHAPRLASVDDAIRRRMRVIPFTKTPAKPDLQLGERLRKEYPGILRWMIDGCLDWQQNGLIVPPVVDAETNRYLSAEAAVSEPFAAWLEACCELASGNRGIGEQSSHLFDSWRTYASLHGEDAGSKKAFGIELERAGCVSHRTATARLWMGIKLKDLIAR